MMSRRTLAWTLTSGEAGMRTQARGLAAAVADMVIEKTTPPIAHLAAPWPLWPRSSPLRALEPPWPDVVVSCGRRSVALALAVKRWSGGRTVAAHVQDPRRRADRFDLVVAMAHDRIAEGPRVIKVATALHDLTPEGLAREAAPWRAQLTALGSPLIGVVVGGDLKGRPFTIDDGRRLVSGLETMRAGSAAGLAITPSRRTTPATRAMLSEALGGDPRVFLWDLEGANPYRAILRLADRLVVTGDSVSMISEAISTSAAVDVLDLGFPRHAGFLQSLVDSGRVRRFDGDPAFAPSATPVNATDTAAEALRRVLAERLG